MSNASATVPAFDFDAFAYVGATSTIEVGGFTVTATLYRDDDATPPWDREDGHGEVTDWTSRDKAPGEVILSSDRGSHRFYDMAGAVALAKRDWIGDAIPYRTRGIAAAIAAQSDFETLKAWCNDEWEYVGVCLSVSKGGVDLTGRYGASVWGTECGGPGFTGSHLNELASELVEEALDAARDALARLAA